MARTYLLTLAGLVGLSFLTFGLSFAPLGNWSVPTAMVIATAKASLVAAIFMELREHGTSHRAALAFGLVLCALLIGFVTLDLATRVLVTPLANR